MKRIFILLVIALLGTGFSAMAFAEGLDQAVNFAQNPEIKQINAFLNKFYKYSNAHDLEEIKKFYAQNYISGDGLKKDELINIIKETWDNYPDIKYISDIKDIRVNENLASIESYDKATSVSAKKSTITSEPGTLDSVSHNIIYLEKLGKGWKIVSDKVYYENTIIKYGAAKNINIRFSAPEQVFSGENYTASLYTDIPPKTIVFGSITKEPIVYPQAKPDEIFRQIPPDQGILERVLKANNTNNNELSAASLGFTEIAGDYSNPDLKLTGIAILLQRVNVLPKSSYVPVQSKTHEDQEPEEDITPQDLEQNDAVE